MIDRQQRNFHSFEHIVKLGRSILRCKITSQMLRHGGLVNILDPDLLLQHGIHGPWGRNVARKIFAFQWVMVRKGVAIGEWSWKMGFNPVRPRQ